MNEALFAQYSGLCGKSLVRANAKSGDSVANSFHPDKGARFNHTITDFAVRHADQSELEHEALERAVKTGRELGEMGL